MFSPLNNISPPPGLYRPLITLKNVVFPEPFGPIMLNYFTFINMEIKRFNSG
ncbi:MAG TPA: hypothetical protein VGK02_06825 [Candidatus Aquicultor sp.]